MYNIYFSSHIPQTTISVAANTVMSYSITVNNQIVDSRSIEPLQDTEFTLYPARLDCWEFSNFYQVDVEIINDGDKSLSTYYAVRGIGKSGNVYDYLLHNFVSSRPRIGRFNSSSYIALSYVAVLSGVVKIQLYSGDNTQTITYAELDARDVYDIVISYDNMLLLTGYNHIDRLDVWVETIDGNTDKMIYYYRNRLIGDRSYVWRNQLGGFESATINGVLTSSMETTGNSYITNNTTRKIPTSTVYRYTHQATVGDIAAWQWIKSIVASHYVMLQDAGELKEIVVSSEDVEGQEQEVNEIEFTYMLSDCSEIEYIHAAQSAELVELPVSISGDITSLYSADSHDNLVVLVQDSDTGEYRKLTISEIRQMQIGITKQY